MVPVSSATNTLEDFVAETFNCLGLDWRMYVISDPSLLRPSEIMISCGDPSKALDKFGWQATYKMRDVVRMMVDAELK